MASMMLPFRHAGSLTLVVSPHRAGLAVDDPCSCGKSFQTPAALACHVKGRKKGQRPHPGSKTPPVTRTFSTSPDLTPDNHPDTGYPCLRPSIR